MKAGSTMPVDVEAAFTPTFALAKIEFKRVQECVVSRCTFAQPSHTSCYLRICTSRLSLSLSSYFVQMPENMEFSM